MAGRGRASVSGPGTASDAIDLSDCPEMIRDVGRAGDRPGPPVRSDVEQRAEPLVPFPCGLLQLTPQTHPLRVRNRTQPPAGPPVRGVERVLAAAPAVQQPEPVPQVVDMG